ncbi:MAG: hypothetical protein WAT93_05665 [Pontixanthobacter sp.]
MTTTMQATNGIAGQGVQRLTVTVRNRPGALLVVHAFADKAKQEIRDKQQKKAKAVKAERNPAQECEAAKYLDATGRECVPVTVIKKALVSAATAMKDLTKVGLRQALFVEPAHDAGAMLIPIETHNGEDAKGAMREDAVTIGINTRGLTYRPQYAEWQLRFVIEYQPTLISQEQLLALLEQAGWGVGICEGRPERSSALGWGRFIVHEWMAE